MKPKQDTMITLRLVLSHLIAIPFMISSADRLIKKPTTNYELGIGNQERDCADEIVLFADCCFQGAETWRKAAWVFVFFTHVQFSKYLLFAPGYSDPLLRSCVWGCQCRCVLSSFHASHKLDHRKILLLDAVSLGRMFNQLIFDT
jgi:hypothetical protein